LGWDCLIPCCSAQITGSRSQLSIAGMQDSNDALTDTSALSTQAQHGLVVNTAADSPMPQQHSRRLQLVSESGNGVEGCQHTVPVLALSASSLAPPLLVSECPNHRRGGDCTTSMHHCHEWGHSGKVDGSIARLLKASRIFQGSESLTHPRCSSKEWLRMHHGLHSCPEKPTSCLNFSDTS
jgi:hypothetical protein